LHEGWNGSEAALDARFHREGKPFFPNLESPLGFDTEIIRLERSQNGVNELLRLRRREQFTRHERPQDEPARWVGRNIELQDARIVTSILWEVNAFPSTKPGKQQE
jgi:hypothetical protein